MGDRRPERLLIRASGSGEKRIELPSVAVRIGRGPDNQVVLPDQYVSSGHAELFSQDGLRYVRDLGSTNGTRVNGYLLSADAPVALQDGDTLQIGPYTLTYRQGAPGASKSPSGWIAPEVASSPEVEASLRLEPHRRFAGNVLRRVLALGAALLVLAALLFFLSPPRVSLLVLGSDARPDEVRRGERGRTDTLLTIVADRPPVGCALVSLPRDLWVEIPGYGEERINTAYAFGGGDLARRAVGDALGIRVDRYLLVGLQGVRDIVDAAGGVEVDVEMPIHDDAYPTDDYGTIVVDIPAGRQRMDGETALRYARTRDQDTDFGRIGRQQRLLVALRARLLHPANWWRLPAVLVAVRQTTRTDLSPFDSAALVLSLVGSGTEPERLVVGPGLVQPFMGADGAFLLRPSPYLRRSVGILVSPTSARVEVLNATASAGRARQAAETLQSHGMQAVRFGDAPPSQSTSIEVRTGGTRAGRQIAALLGLPQDIVSESAALPDDLDVRVVLGAQRT